MIVAPDATAVDDIVLLETWQGPGKVRLGYTEIDEIFLLCNACEQGPCKIDYWIRGKDNITASCQKCPQWRCDDDCVGETIPKILSPSPYSGFAVPVVPSPYSGFAAPIVQNVYSEQSDNDSDSLVLALTRIQHNNNGGDYV